MEGDAGEALMRHNHPSYQKITTDDRYDSVDFINPATDKLAELKSDTGYLVNPVPLDELYPKLINPNKIPRYSENFFMERISNDKTGSLGGPFRDPITDHYVYLFYYNELAYWFNTQQLVDRLWELYPDMENHLHPVYNKYFTTWGLKVPRIDLKDICIRREKWNVI